MQVFLNEFILRKDRAKCGYAVSFGFISTKLAQHCKSISESGGPLMAMVISLDYDTGSR